MPEHATRWIIKRNCSASPRQLAAVFVSIVALSFVFGAAFAAHGLWMVLPFVGVELIALAVAFICYGMRAANFEVIELDAGRLRIEQFHGSRHSTWQLAAPRARIETKADAGAPDRARLFVVTAHERIEIGTDLLGERRQRLGLELKQALRTAATAAA
ncbi:MAG: DUF2244 domain-containing protein [Gemmatimonadota bacterium]